MGKHSLLAIGHVPDTILTKTINTHILFLPIRYGICFRLKKLSNKNLLWGWSCKSIICHLWLGVTHHHIPRLTPVFKRLALKSISSKSPVPIQLLPRIYFRHGECWAQSSPKNPSRCWSRCLAGMCLEIITLSVMSNWLMNSYNTGEQPEDAWKCWGRRWIRQDGYQKPSVEARPAHRSAVGIHLFAVLLG